MNAESGTIDWSVDGRPAGSTSGGGSLDWPLVPDTHRIEARDPRGRMAASTITVR